MYRFYKGEEKIGRWKSVAVENQEAKLALNGVHFATVLAVDQKPKKGEAIAGDAKYLGPFYIDIDCDDIGQSIKALKRTLATLRGNGLEENQMYIWASGKRGFHILVPMRVFTHEVPTRRLPFIYKQLMLMMRLPDEVDKTVYSSGKGRMWRLPGKLRSEIGTYKVRIGFEEATNLTEDLLQEIIKTPREETPIIPIGTSVKFAAMYRQAASKADAVELDNKGVFVDPVMRKALEGELPPCAKQMLNYEVDEDVGFNAVSLQMGKAIASFAPQKAEELIEQFAEKAKGQSYNTVDKRKAHAKQAFTQAIRNSSYSWACPSALSVLENDSCCENCPIAYIRFIAEKEESDEEGETVTQVSGPVDEPGTAKPQPEPAESLSKYAHLAVEDLKGAGEPVNPNAPTYLPECIRNLKKNASAIPSKSFKGIVEYNEQGLVETETGYGFMNPMGQLRTISNFTFVPLKSFVEYVPNLSRDVRTGTMVAVYIDGSYAGNSFLDDRCWNSKAAFISAFTGLSNASFYGKDDDVQRMKAAIMTNKNTGNTVRRVYSAGIHRERIGEEFVFTYVEPDWSIDQFGNQDTYQLSGKINGVSELKEIRDLGYKDTKVSAALRYMLRSNTAVSVAQVLGWTMACFLKQHIFAFRNEFPLLSLHGEPGSGKTSTIGLFASLHGCDFRLESSPINLPTATSFVVWKFIAGTTTMPRLIEEFNKSKMPRNYDIYAENFKACWNQHSVQRGSIDRKGAHGQSTGGAFVEEIALTGPVALCSEQQIVMPALVERTIQIRYSQAMRKEYSQDFGMAQELANAGYYTPFARACYMEALGLTVEDVKKWITASEELVPKDMSTRPRYSYQVIFAGLRFFDYIAKKYDLDCMKEFTSVLSEFTSWISDNARELVSSKKISEVDIIMAKLNTMAALSSQEGSVAYLLSGVHYLIAKDYLYLDILTCHANYLRYTTSIEREIPVINNVKEFRELMRGEKYCMSTTEKLEDFAENRELAVLRISDLASKGIDISGFKRRSD